jgi:2,5-diketo-D-gluconate reductase A
MPAVPTVPLNNGVRIPQLRLGTARIPDEETRRIVREALEVGDRFVDTAASYENEVGVGQGIADSGVPRDQVFVSTKLRGSEQGRASAEQALRSSLDRLGWTSWTSSSSTGRCPGWTATSTPGWRWRSCWPRA